MGNASVKPSEGHTHKHGHGRHTHKRSHGHKHGRHGHRHKRSHRHKRHYSGGTPSQLGPNKGPSSPSKKRKFKVEGSLHKEILEHEALKAHEAQKARVAAKHKPRSRRVSL